MLIFFQSKQILIDYLGLVYLALLPHLLGNFDICFLITRLLSVYDTSEHPLTEQISPFHAISILESFSFDTTFTNPSLDLLDKLKILDISLMNFLND